MWSLHGTAAPKPRFEPFAPIEVLDDYDGPRLFTLSDAEGELNLAYWSDADQQICRYVVVPTTPRIVNALKNGNISLHSALNQPRCWLCDVTHQGELTACQRVEFEAIPRDSLPAMGTMLERAFEPEPQRVDMQGRIRELDKDQLSFDLREIDGGQHTQRFIFDEELLGEVVRAFDENVRVKVAGRTVPIKNLAQALALSRMSATGS